MSAMANWLYSEARFFCLCFEVRLKSIIIFIKKKKINNHVEYRSPLVQPSGFTGLHTDCFDKLG